MDNYRKDFIGWARIAEEVEKRELGLMVRKGGIYWANIGVGIGSEEVGKGNRFTRPVLVLAKINERTVYAIPITSQPKHRRDYREIIVAGKTEFLIVCQGRPLDVLRLEHFIDEVAPQELGDIWRYWLKTMRYHFYKKSSSTEVEPDF